MAQICASIGRLAHTLVLFTYRDHATTLMPVMIFAVVAAPVHSVAVFLKAILWIWCHLLQFGVSNQYIAIEEDIANRPWRPIPSQRISFKHATVLRWIMLAWCTAHSSLHGRTVFGASLALSAVTFAHNELRLGDHWFLKSICNAIGYACFEIGATAIMSGSCALDSTARLSISLSASVILFTIPMQDFPDVEGDALQGRTTFPIAFPRFSRYFTSLMLVVWSLSLGAIWGISAVPLTVFLVLGFWVAGRTWTSDCSETYDSQTYFYFNVWLFTAHLLPLTARM